MLDIDIEEELIRRVGGKFKLTTLMQKRMVELNRGERPLVKLEEPQSNLRRVVCEEILQGKIELASKDEIGYTVQEEKPRIEADGGETPATTNEKAIYGSDIKKIKEQRIKELSQLLNPKK